LMMKPVPTILAPAIKTPERTVIVNAPQKAAYKPGFFDTIIQDIEAFINKLKSGNLSQIYKTNQWDGLGQTRRAAQRRYRSTIHSQRPDGTLRELEEE